MKLIEISSEEVRGRLPTIYCYFAVPSCILLSSVVAIIPYGRFHRMRAKGHQHSTNDTSPSAVTIHKLSVVRSRSACERTKKEKSSRSTICPVRSISCRVRELLKFKRSSLLVTIHRISALPTVVMRFCENN